MNKLGTLWPIIIVLAVIAIIFGSYLLGWRHGLNNLSITSANPTQLANAMKSDDFFANYNEKTILVHGVVSSLTNQAQSTTIGLRNSSTYATFCQLNTKDSSLKIGDSVFLAAIGATAERDAKGVTLKNCSLLAS